MLANCCQAPTAAKQALFNYTPVDKHANTDYLHVYDNLFRCMCNIDPALFPGDQPLVEDSLYLLQAAEAIQAVPCVRRDIETHLLRTGAYLWKLVLKDVETWAGIGVRLRSPVIFRESMIRIVGLWNVNSAIKKQNLLNTDNGVDLYDIAERKVEEQIQHKKEIEERLRTFFPQAMLHPPSNDPTAITPGRAFYANDVYYWHALALVRQYIVRETMAGHGYAASDGGAMFYNTIGNGGGSYCRAADLDEWHKKFDMTAKGKQRLRDSLTTVKNEMKTVVAELMVSRSNIARLDGDYPYLTHTEFKDEELPWYSAPTFSIKRPSPAAASFRRDDEDVPGLFVSQEPALPAVGNSAAVRMGSPSNSVLRSSPLSSPPKSDGSGGANFGYDQANSGPSNPVRQNGPEVSQSASKRRKVN